MSVNVIPIDNADELANFFFNISLDDITFNLFFKYNRREGFFYVDILDIENNPIRTGLKIVVNYPLLQRCALLNAPRGELMAIDTRPEPQDPTLEDFGKEQVFSYIEEESLP